MRTASRFSTVSGGGSGAIRRMYAIRSRSIGSVSTRVPSSSTSTVAWPTYVTASELIGGASQVHRSGEADVEAAVHQHAKQDPRVDAGHRPGVRVRRAERVDELLPGRDPELAIRAAEVELD